MTDMPDVLPGLESGRRTEVVEWGLRCPHTAIGPADVERAANRDHAERMAKTMNALPLGPGYDAVSRTTVTYTTAWKTPETVVDDDHDFVDDGLRGWITD